MKTQPLPSWSAQTLSVLSRRELIQAAQLRVDEALQRCREVYPTLPAPGVWFDLKGASAGQAHLGRGGLRFNPVLLSDNRQVFFDEVIPHEMAHWLVFHLANGTRLKPHGREWQAVMRDLFGLAPNVTHQLDIQYAQPRPYCYQCGCQTHRFTAKRHSLVVKGRRYRCRHCDQTLVYSAFEKP
ncbi:SprT-like domain-containing protein [Vreelandella zhaodongensis]|uniref:SprT-like domain-containing protein n=1 Tax=Vreelandella zhaodongensis TaxID=1176240 RepID=A0ABX2SWC0_VREZH|nr:SprT-like domain-containing protein [Halomonas zhaodongensis]NYS45506.1 SprT-like domain-containing protein [Halomonas zhaodongensis]